jgi:hypothetical protein
MNVLRGFDFPFQCSHHYGRASLGDYNANNGASTPFPANPDRRSIDQVMAWSPNFYNSTAGIQARSVTLFTGGDRPSHAYADPAVGASSGINDLTPTAQSSWDLFDQLFPSPPTSGPPATRPLIVDLVLQDYQRLRNSNRRLSTADKQRLDDHVQRIYELQRKLQTTTAPACNAITKPATNNSSIAGSYFNTSSGYATAAPFDGTSSSPSLQSQYWDMYNDVLAAALHCGATRVAVVLMDATQADFSTVPGGTWHTTTPAGVAHSCNYEDGPSGTQPVMVQAFSNFFSGVVLDLAQKLDAAAETSGTTLDRSLVMWTSEHGNRIHLQMTMPVITFGSGGGYFKTGNYCDYRNLTKLGPPPDNGSVTDPGSQVAPGLVWNQMWANCLTAMGVQRSEYQETNHNGYGLRIADPVSNWPDAVWNAAGDKLPFL